MARSRSRRSNRSDPTLFFGIIAACVVFLIIIGSFLNFVAWVYFEYRARKLLIPAQCNYFSHTPEELSEISSINKECSTVSKRLTQIEIEGSSLTKRQDGMYNARSQKGKALNSEITMLRPKQYRLYDEYDELIDLPTERLANWAFYKSMNMALRTSMFVYICSSIMLLVIEPLWLTQLSDTIQNWSVLDFFSSYPLVYGISISAFLISLFSLVGGFFLFRELTIESFENEKQEHENIKCDQQREGSKKNITMTDFTDQLSALSHSDLKNIVEKHAIKADKRSKSSIVNAICNSGEEVIYKINIELSVMC